MDAVVKLSHKEGSHCLAYSLSKRLFDILFSACVLIAASPFLFTIALLVKVSSPGPVFYCSLRLGKEKRLFRFWKFRSMYRDADERLEDLLSGNLRLKEEWNTYFKLKNDPRLTRIGRFLRRTSLDEFPQFWNVLIGDLSVVGPRPYLPREGEKIDEILQEKTTRLFSLRPGLTGLWQTSGRNFLTFEQRVKLDLKYVEEHSFFTDLRFIGKTIPMLLFPKGAF